MFLKIPWPALLEARYHHVLLHQQFYPVYTGKVDSIGHVLLHCPFYNNIQSQCNPDPVNFTRKIWTLLSSSFLLIPLEITKLLNFVFRHVGYAMQIAWKNIVRTKSNNRKPCGRLVYAQINIFYWNLHAGMEPTCTKSLVWTT